MKRECSSKIERVPDILDTVAALHISIDNSEPDAPLLHEAAEELSRLADDD
jgi:hypothetical protein